MTPAPLHTYAGRFVLPLVLLAAAIGAWFLAARLDQVERAQTPVTSSGEIGAPLASVRRLPEFAFTAATEAELADTLELIGDDPGGLSCAVVLVDGLPIYSLRSDRTLVPAYAQLFLTAHVALDLLGPDYRYTTQLLTRDLPDDNGSISSNVYLDGGGDPVLMSYGYAVSQRPARSVRTPIEDLAQAVADAGVTRIDGGVVGIDRRYDDQHVPSGLPEDVAAAGIVGSLSALQLDAGIETRPAGNLGVAVLAEEPAALAAERFDDRLEALDIAIAGTSRAAFVEEELPTLLPIADIESPPLRDIVFQMVAVNDANAAEMIVKELGFVVGNEGSAQEGNRIIQRTLQEQGVDVPVAFRDGSGLDSFSATSCDQLATAADGVPEGHPTLDALGRYDLPGVFGGRFVELDLESDLRLVGGVADEASGLVARTVDEGRRVTIATIVNRPGGPSEADLAFQQSLVELVDALREETTLDTTVLGD